MIDWGRGYLFRIDGNGLGKGGEMGRGKGERGGEEVWIFRKLWGGGVVKCDVLKKVVDRVEY